MGKRAEKVGLGIPALTRQWRLLAQDLHVVALSVRDARRETERAFAAEIQRRQQMRAPQKRLIRR